MNLPLAILMASSIEAIDNKAISWIDLLIQRASNDPLCWISTLLFLGAILHTFLASSFSKKAHLLEQKSGICCLSRCFHLLGEVEIVFALWLIPLALSFVTCKGWNATVEYFEHRNYTEAIFVIVIMTMAASRPILSLAQAILRFVVRLFGWERPSTWWFCILAFAPLLGSLMTEPATMTIAALLLARQVFVYQPTPAFLYASLGLLFVNVSIGGVLTHFAAPPVLMVASPWHWDSAFMFQHFGRETLVSLLLSTCFYALLFSKQLRALNLKAKLSAISASSEDSQKFPKWVIVTHIAFLVWTVFNAHCIPLLIWGFLAFLTFTRVALPPKESDGSFKGALLVGAFLAGLVTHGGLQEWWIEVVLSQLGETSLFWGSLFLTAFNDNASITYLASLVPAFASNFTLQYAVVSGAVAGGGLTVIANAPNPAGQSLLSKFFPNSSVKPFPLFLGALPPTLFVIFSFRVLVHWLG